MKWASWVTLIVGGWLFIAPSALGFPMAVETNISVMLGVLVVIASAWSLSAPDNSAVPDWLLVAFGVLMFISPWLLGYAAIYAAVWNAVVTGGLLAACALLHRARRVAVI